MESQAYEQLTVGFANHSLDGRRCDGISGLRTSDCRVCKSQPRQSHLRPRLPQSLTAPTLAPQLYSHHGSRTGHLTLGSPYGSRTTITHSLDSRNIDGHGPYSQSADTHCLDNRSTGAHGTDIHNVDSRNTDLHPNESPTIDQSNE